MKKRELLAFGIGLIVGSIVVNQLLPPQDHSHNGTHQITQPDEEYHVHADFLIYLDDEKIDLAKDEYMTTAENAPHEHAHLHDGNGEVKHIHKQGITFVEFLDSLDMVVTEECVSFAGTDYCSGTENMLALYVNYEPYNDPITEYEPVDDDSILLYYGAYDPEQITEYMNEVKDDACYYSGTCPERGVAPPESCGLTCEI